MTGKFSSCSPNLVPGEDAEFTSVQDFLSSVPTLLFQ